MYRYIPGIVLRGFACILLRHSSFLHLVESESLFRREVPGTFGILKYTRSVMLLFQVAFLLSSSLLLGIQNWSTFQETVSFFHSSRSIRAHFKGNSVVQLTYQIQDSWATIYDSLVALQSTHAWIMRNKGGNCPVSPLVAMRLLKYGMR